MSNKRNFWKQSKYVIAKRPKYLGRSIRHIESKLEGNQILLWTPCVYLASENLNKIRKISNK